MRIIFFLKSLSKRRLQILLMILQLTISIFAFTVTGAFALDKYNQYMFQKSVFDIDRMLTIDTSAGDPHLDTSNVQKIYEELLMFKQNGDIKNVKVVSNFYIEVPQLKNISMELSTHEQDETSYITRVSLVSKEFMKDYKLKLKEGRSFNDEDFQLNEVMEEEPIIIGYNLAEYLKVGDIIIDKKVFDKGNLTIERRYKVIGVAQKGSLIYVNSGSSSGLANLRLDDNAIYKPFNKVKAAVVGENNKLVEGNINELEEALYVAQNMFVEVEDKESIDRIKDEVERLFNNYNLPYKVDKHSEESSRLLQETKSFVIEAAAFAIVITLLSVIGIAGTLLFSIKGRFREFGIRLSQGATLNNLCKLVCCELMFVNILSFSIASVGGYFALKNFQLYDLSALIGHIYGFSIGIFELVTVLTVIVPLRQIKKLNPVELIRGGL
jgi:ABC-type antimicrobial peptide transport system permease subunit